MEREIRLNRVITTENNFLFYVKKIVDIQYNRKKYLDQLRFFNFQFIVGKITESFY